MPRKYELKKRAERQHETWLRIVEATIELHQTMGGQNTTISAIAERAGVERATIYRHFPDERSLVGACTSHYFAQNPPPELAAWERMDDPEERLRTGLVQIYVYHRRTEAMSARAASDLPQVPVLREVLAPVFEYWGRVRAVLAAPWGTARAGEAVRAAAIGHAIAFSTWQSLVREQGLEDADAVELMVRMVRCAERVV